MNKKELIKQWKDTPKPKSFTTNINSLDEAIMELKEVEEYFLGKNWDEIDPEHYDIRHMCALLWMNDKAASYYSLSYLLYLNSSKAKDSIYDTPDLVLSYFESEFSILPKLNTLQRQLANEILLNYKKSQKL